MASNTAAVPQEVAPWVERLARVGYAAKAVLYLTIGLLAARAALGTGGRVTDTQGALRAVHHERFGTILLFIIAAGLLGYAVWRLVEAALDPEHRGRDLKGILIRSGFVIRGLFHGALGITALRLALGARQGRGDQAREWAARGFDLPLGDLLVGLAGLGIAGYGVYQLYRAWASKLSRNLRLGEVPGSFRRWIVGVSRFGIGARGVVFCLIGFFMARAALRHNAAEVRGVRESLQIIAHVGEWPFAVAAFGLIAYGIYELVNARYRRIRLGESPP